ncbi:hypothetical protein TrCOL_g1223 [Triparma columacea]|uniref:Uncharacterized protein n=1 Tax=Triparma columacea TaxID=722753 RepID=A0A9W7GM19_9STRA|nr:hypothetical protein TrCOL_g1223 [Triparma columacea]
MKSSDIILQLEEKINNLKDEENTGVMERKDKIGHIEVMIPSPSPLVHTLRRTTTTSPTTTTSEDACIRELEALMLGIEVTEFHAEIYNRDDDNEPPSLPTKSSSVLPSNTSGGRVCVNHFVDPSPVVRYSDEPPEFTDGRVDFGVRDCGIDDITREYNNNVNVCNEVGVEKVVKKNKIRRGKKKSSKNKENATTALAFGSTPGAFLSPNTLRLVKTVVEEKGKGEGIEREVRTNAMVFQGLF